MAKQYWLQYHNYEAVKGPPGIGGISTNRDHFKDKLRLGEDIIFLMVGIQPQEHKLIECEMSPSILYDIDKQQRLYFLWEKFIPEGWDYTGEKQYGGFDYEIYGKSANCTLFLDPPIILKSEAFKDFWSSYCLHGFICLSSIRRCPFPELQETGEGLVYSSRNLSPSSTLNISEVVVVPQEVMNSIAFIKQRLPRYQWANWQQAIPILRQYGHSAAASWIDSHRQEYVAGWQQGFQVQLD